MGKKSIGHFHTKIAGVTHENRQALVPHLGRFQQLNMDHDEENEHDENAVKLLTSDKRQVGFLKREVAAEVVSEIKQGILFSCFVSEVTGGTPDKPTYGCNLLIVWARPETTQREQEAYCESIGLPVQRTAVARLIPANGAKFYRAQESIFDKLKSFMGWR